jgi:hypothetical protein
MHIARHSPRELVVVDGTRWLALFFLAVAALLTFFAVTRYEYKLLFVTGFFLLFAALFTRRTTVTLDGMQRIANWRARTFLTVKSGAIPFDDITDIVLDATSGDHGSMVYRLSMVTAAGNTPMASAFATGVKHYESLRGQILEFIKPGSSVSTSAPGILSDGIPTELESSLRSMLQQGRKIDAVELLRSTRQISLTEAVARINALDEKQRTTS